MFTPHGTFSPVQFALPLTITILCLAFWGWMFRDMMNNDALPRSAKYNWTIAFVLLNVFGAVIYFTMVYRNRR
jgi:hypothetical protein